MAAVPNAGGSFNFGPSGERAPAANQPAQGTGNPVGGVGSNQHQNLPPGAVQGTGAQGAQAPAPAPLDKFKDLFAPKLGADGKPEAEPTKKPMFNFDEGKFMETLTKINFAQRVSPELIEKALGGDKAAFSESLNEVARMVFGYNMQSTMKMVEHAVESQIGTLRGEIPGMVQKHQVNNTMQEDPALSHPAMAPMREAMTETFTRKYPHASQEQIKQHVSEYLQAVKATLVGQDPSATGASGSKGVGSEPDDWGKFMEELTPGQGS